VSFILKGTEGNGWSKYINSIIKIIYEDGKSPSGSPHFSTREGKLIAYSDSHIILLINGQERGFNKQKILRFEVRGSCHG